MFDFLNRDDRTDEEKIAELQQKVETLEAIIQVLYRQHLKSGGEPAFMNVDLIREWLVASGIQHPRFLDSTQSTNLFQGTFHKPLTPDEIRKIEALGFDVESSSSRLGYAFWFKWRPSIDDEEGDDIT